MDFSRIIPKVEEIQEEVQVLQSHGPWRTKSNGELMVLYATTLDLFKKIAGKFAKDFFSYDEEELAKIPTDIRGFRIYTVQNLSKGQIGGTEFHRIRKEFFFGLGGAVLLTCDDLFGDSRTFTIDTKSGIYMPNYLRHTYQVLEDNSGFMVIANTLFIPDDRRTHDTYDSAEFATLKKQVEEYCHEKQKHS